MSTPNTKKPCKDCPFRKDSQEGWLGKNRMKEILNSNSFTCHKTPDNARLQCAGHMLMTGMDNEFLRLAARLNIDTQISGKELVFDNKESCINHHTY